MRKSIYIIILSLCMFIANIHAENHLGVHLTPLVAWQIDPIDAARPLAGGGGELGIVYQYQYDMFLLQTGIDLHATHMRQGIDSMMIAPDTLISNRVDKINRIGCAIPLMVGFQARYIYALVGAKVLLPCHAGYVGDATLSIREADDRYHEDFNQSFIHPHAIQSRSRMLLDMDVYACLEAGTKLSLYNPEIELQIGLFAQCGLLNTRPSFHELQDADASINMPLSSIITTHMQQPRKAALSSVQVGVRCAVMLELAPSRKKCNCDPW